MNSDEAERRLAAIQTRVAWFLAEADVETFWEEDAAIPYTLLRTAPASCKIVWDDGVTAYVNS